MAWRPTTWLSTVTSARLFSISMIPQTCDWPRNWLPVLLLNRVIIQAEGLETAGLEVFDENISTGSQFLGQSQVCGIIEIENNRALVTVDSHVVGRHAIAVWWHPGTSVIPRGAFDLNHRCTEVTKQHGTVRASEYSREVGDQQSVERAGSPRGFLIVLLRHKVHTSGVPPL